MSKLWYVALGFILVLHTTGIAAPPWSLRLPPAEALRGDYYLWPNETSPAPAIGNYRNAEEGFLMTVGTERAWIGLALGSRFEGAVFMDNSPEVLVFHQINAALILAAKDRKDYLRLRMSGEWMERFQEHPDLDVRRIMSDRNYAAWWKKNVSESDLFHSLHQGTGFSGANYLHDDDLFENLKDLVENKKIAIVPVDLARPQVFERLNLALQKTDVRISMLDLSNAWWNKWTKREALGRTYEVIRTRMTPGGRILITSGRAEGGWAYITRGAASLANGQALEAYLDEVERRERAQPGIYSNELVDGLEWKVITEVLGQFEAVKCKLNQLGKNP